MLLDYDKNKVHYHSNAVEGCLKRWRRSWNTRLTVEVLTIQLKHSVRSVSLYSLLRGFLLSPSLAMDRYNRFYAASVIYNTCDFRLRMKKSWLIWFFYIRLFDNNSIIDLSRHIQWFNFINYMCKQPEALRFFDIKQITWNRNQNTLIRLILRFWVGYYSWTE